VKIAVLLVHNRYQQPGGEDQVFASEAALLEAKGHRVIRYEDDNSRVEHWGAANALDAIWSSASARKIGELVRKHKPDLVHFHNTFPLISPAVYYAVQSEGVPVVQTLHNFRLICPGATLYRDGSVCEECIQKRSLRPAMAHKCYRGSRPATAAVAAMLELHRIAGTWRRKVDVYIALSELARRKFIAGGLPESRLVVKPNFVSPEPEAGSGSGGYALFAGRLSAEKGIRTMLEAWKDLADIPLVVAGDGPLAQTGPPFIGRQTREKVLELMREARVLIFPSEAYEGAALVIIEALACGLPVVASDLGSAPRSGWVFRAGDPADLARAVRLAFSTHGDVAMRAQARQEFEEKYTADRNYEMLMAIYERARARDRAA
jgi:glycosyltransferase involved in cell wall biosynthesis